MHLSSHQEMEKFRDTRLTNRAGLVLDVGSMDVNGTYQDLFGPFPQWVYAGLDCEKGPNVDLLIRSDMTWPFEDGSVDIIISGQCIEHVPDLQLWFHELGRVLKPGGICCVIAPWKCAEHKYPVDCWRFFPDGLRHLLETTAGLSVLDCFINNTDNFDVRDCGDCVGIAEKVAPRE